MILIVAPLRLVPDVIAARRPSHVLTLVGHETPAPVCTGLADGCHLTLRTNDIVAATPGLIAPSPPLIRDILAFGTAWDRRAPLLVHCLAGISRSTAAAYILACAAAAPGTEADIANALRAASPTATPNLLMVALADTLLARDGAMLAAVKRMGRGAEAAEAAPFDLAIGSALR